MQSKYTARELKRFWGNVDKKKSDIFYLGSRCWEWTAGHDPRGYGKILMNRKHCRAHRVSYELAFGEISNGLGILHHCDNHPCVNPLHLFAGTPQDNVDDMMMKRRHVAPGPKHPAHGESHGKHKLSDVQVSEIRRRYKRYSRGEGNLSSLAKDFGISRTHVHRILKNKYRVRA